MTKYDNDLHDLRADAPVLQLFRFFSSERPSNAHAYMDAVVCLIAGALGSSDRLPIALKQVLARHAHVHAAWRCGLQRRLLGC